MEWVKEQEKDGLKNLEYGKNQSPDKRTNYTKISKYL